MTMKDLNTRIPPTMCLIPLKLKQEDNNRQALPPFPQSNNKIHTFSIVNITPNAKSCQKSNEYPEEIMVMISVSKISHPAFEAFYISRAYIIISIMTTIPHIHLVADGYDRVHVHWMTVKKGLHYVDIWTGHLPLSTSKLFHYIEYAAVKPTILTLLGNKNSSDISTLNSFLIDIINKQIKYKEVNGRYNLYQERG